MADILSERMNPGRRLRAQDLGANPDLIIQVEGWKDRLWLKKNIVSERSNDGRRIEIDYDDDGGKDEVISRVSECKREGPHYGIVDMDHDFSGENITVPQLVDTRMYCTLFSPIINRLTDEDLYRIFEKITCPEDMVELVSKRNNGSMIKISDVRKYAKFATKIRLFWGWNGPNHGLGKKEEIIQAWFEYCLGESSGNEYSFIQEWGWNKELDLWEDFENSNANFLESCGANDHDFEKCIEKWYVKNIGKKFNKRKFDGIIGHQFSLRLDDIPDEFIEHLKGWNVIVE